MTSPTLGVALLTALLSCRSARWGVSVTLAVSLPGVGSNWSLWLTAAVLVVARGQETRALTGSRALPGPARVPTGHTPDALLEVPACVWALTKLRLAGTGSLTLTLVAGSGPLLVRVTV